MSTGGLDGEEPHAGGGTCLAVELLFERRSLLGEGVALGGECLAERHIRGCKLLVEALDLALDVLDLAAHRVGLDRPHVGDRLARPRIDEVLGYLWRRLGRRERDGTDLGVDVDLDLAREQSRVLAVPDPLGDTAGDLAEQR